MIKCLVPALAHLALVASTSGAAAQEALTGELRVTVADGIVLGLSMSGVTWPSTSGLGSRVGVQDGEVYRLIVDEAGRARFSYAIRIDPRAKGVELIFRPVRLHEAVRAFAPQQRTYDLPFRLESGLVTLSDIQTSGVMSAGDSVTLDLFDNRDTGQSIGDQVRLIAVSPKAIEQLAATRKARVESRGVLTVAGMTIRRAGRVIWSDAPGTFATGHVVGLGLGADVGTVIFSAEPPQNEAPYGVATVDGPTLRFTLDGQEYSTRARSPLVHRDSPRSGCTCSANRPLRERSLGCGERQRGRVAEDVARTGSIGNRHFRRRRSVVARSRRGYRRQGATGDRPSTSRS